MKRLITLALVLLAVSGCASIDKSYPERRYYQFDTSYSGHQYTPVPGTVLAIKRMQIAPSSDGLEFIYRTGDFKYQSDFYNQFFRPPGTLITEAINSWFSGSGMFEDVLGLLSQAYANYEIEGNVVKLYGDYRSAASPKAVLEMQLFLLKITEDNDSPIIVTSGTYSTEKPISGRDPKALMAGWNQALIEILGKFQNDVNQNLRKSMEPPPAPPAPGGP